MWFAFFFDNDDDTAGDNLDTDRTGDAGNTGAAGDVDEEHEGEGGKVQVYFLFNNSHELVSAYAEKEDAAKDNNIGEAVMMTTQQGEGHVLGLGDMGECTIFALWFLVLCENLRDERIDSSSSTQILFLVHTYTCFSSSRYPPAQSLIGFQI